MTGEFAAVAAGAAVGAVLRYATDLFLRDRTDMVLPWGTLTVNAVGSLLLGFLAAGMSAGAVPGWAVLVAGTGLCGALTTFSTFGYETLRLAESGARAYALANVALTLVAGLGAAVLGWTAALAVWPPGS
ncbi:MULTISPECIES: fluoride efflux transporter CrcB [unclassified Nocardiopsis]|uniref:fluoride efflux transporter CrcB n=1 Tax=unclassified Nocardiopsis TaxID=2649073 RepID=UPI00135B44F6|nr:MULTISPECIES: fluoride efflux transporter CrcB [unclassified Nocardiopsis]